MREGVPEAVSAVGLSTVGIGLALLALATASTVAGGFPPDVAQALRASKHIYVATRRADGTRSAAAPVWFMVDGDTVLFTTGPDSHKARRIRRGSPVFVWVGSADGPHFVGAAEVLQDPALAARMAPVYAQKYWIAWLGLFRPNPDRVRAGKTAIVRVSPAS
jgi:PPOX class probable F420-dependent enzyme